MTNRSRRVIIVVVCVFVTILLLLLSLFDGDSRIAIQSLIVIGEFLPALRVDVESGARLHGGGALGNAARFLQLAVLNAASVGQAVDVVVAGGESADQWLRRAHVVLLLVLVVEQDVGLVLRGLAAELSAVEIGHVLLVRLAQALGGGDGVVAAHVAAILVKTITDLLRIPASITHFFLF